MEHLLSVGTGNGVVAVWDRRAGRYLEDPAADVTAASPAAAGIPITAPQTFEPQLPSPKPLALEMTGGFLERNHIYT